MNMRCAALTIVCLGWCSPGLSFAASLPDRVDVAAIQTAEAQHEPALALAAAGERVVAVGLRGHAFWSDDQGSHWQQAAVPVSADLTAVDFVSAQRGWAVGHDGVVLRTDDGGESWQRQLDGRAVSALYNARAEALQESDPALAQRYAQYADQGLNQSFLAVHFDNHNDGFVAGAYNLLLRTRDGGSSWEPWLEQVDNPGALHLYGIARVGERLYMAGEQGLLLRQSDDGNHFEALASPYAGTLFGLIGNDRLLLIHGLRGNVWISDDQGAHWREADVATESAITGASVSPSGDLVLVSQAGVLLRSSDDGHHFERVPVRERFPFFDVLAVDDEHFIVCGMRGMSALHENRRAGEQ